MNPQMPILLRQKYSLVHVPGVRRSMQWVERCRQELDQGVPPERAGLTAALAVFPYEARERPIPGASSVMEILALA